MSQVINDKTLHLMLDKLSIGIVFLDSDGIITYCNQAASSLLGLKRERLIGLSTEQIKNERLKKETENIISFFKNGGQDWRTNINHNGVLYADYAAVRDEAGNFLGVLVSFCDYNQSLLEEKLAKSNKELRVLYEAGQIFNSTLELPQVLAQIIKVTGDFVPFAKGYVVLYDKEKDTITATVGAGGEALEMNQQEMQEKVMKAIREKNYLLIDGENTEYYIPIVSHDEVMGVYYLAMESGVTLASDQQTILIGICNQAGLAIRNAKMYERINYLATVDGLTKLYNRQFFDTVIKREMERAYRFETPLTLMMVDVNALKHINDHFGHTKGDEIITEAGKILTESVRNVDYVFRYGGDEMVILLLKAEDKIAARVQERIRHNCRLWNEKNGKGDFQVSLSLGFAVAKQGDTPEDLLMRADHMMYKDKERHYRERLNSLLQK